MHEKKSTTALGNFLIEEMYKRHLSYRDLAKLAGISFSRLAVLGSGSTYSVRKSTLEKIARALEIDIEKLVVLAREGYGVSGLTGSEVKRYPAVPVPTVSKRRVALSVALEEFIGKPIDEIIDELLEDKLREVLNAKKSS
jgi:DNA-binding Xre family transcriptional regulator